MKDIKHETLCQDCGGGFESNDCSLCPECESKLYENLKHICDKSATDEDHRDGLKEEKFLNNNR